jgi:hypothetical protein
LFRHCFRNSGRIKPVAKQETRIWHAPAHGFHGSGVIAVIQLPIPCIRARFARWHAQQPAEVNRNRVAGPDFVGLCTRRVGRREHELELSP